MSVVQTLKAFTVEPLKYYTNILISSGCLLIEDVDYEDDNAVYINDYLQEVYCVELGGAGESSSFLPETLISSLCSDFADDEAGEMTWVLIKDGAYKKNLIFTRSKKLAIQISSAVSSKILNFKEVFDRILSLYFNNQYEIDWYKKELVQKYNIDFTDERKSPINLANALIRERAFANYTKVKFYQAVSYNNEIPEGGKKFNIEDFNNIKFTGGLYTKIIFSLERIKEELNHQKFNTTAQFSNTDKNKIKELIKTVDTHNRVMINTVLEVFEDYGSSVATQVERAANCKLDAVSRKQRQFNNKTPVFMLNRDFSRVVEKSFLNDYIAYNSKLDSDKPHLVGYGSDGGFANFGFKKATQMNAIAKPHFILLGTSGAGKTQAANDIFKQLVGYEVETAKLHNIGETNHIIFDIKDSFYGQISQIAKAHPNLVNMNDFNKNEFVYNIIDCDTTTKDGKTFADESDLDFSATLISMILSSGDGESQALTSSETQEFKQALREIYENGYEPMPIADLRESHPKEYKVIRDLGYKEFTPIDELKEPEFKKFKKPLLHNVINLLKQRESEYSNKNQQIRVRLAESIIHKLETINQMQIFSKHSKLDFEAKEIIYFRTDSIVGGEDYGYLVFAMLGILAKKTKAIQHAKRLKNQPRPLIFFWFEEARNIFSNKLFKEKEVFERIINEWRSYDMVFCPITQEPQHIPDSILNGFEVKMILTSGEDEEEKQNLIDNLSSRLAIGDRRRKILQTLPKYTMFVMYGDGAFTMKFKDDEAFRKIVNT
ncbi:MAG: hypothetical protein PHO62_10960 [Sulfurimonas sp.]|uniref:hypothetical protein n=1 Tax=Sulfurimonas sp. TaxID=2022749 RepID=UPI00262BDB09|nr:hypothetical protein [Sulfurimonas sp.]MDD5373930.1 hypothetical protein [Sulfurimonas sp.]